MKQILALTRKELNGYFGSPMALIFIGVFLAATLFTFFWVDTFFARGVAEARSLFRWMPLLLLFLVAALTMRQWSQETQSGTLEILLTLPIRLWKLVIGKFLAVLTLVTLALGLTLSLPITASFLGNLDWGPVIGGYLAALLMASAYAALGLFISSRTRNEIVALILTVVVGSVLYLIGTRQVTEFFSETVGSILRATGNRQPLRKHRARCHRPARLGLLPLAHDIFLGAQRVFARRQALEPEWASRGLSPQRYRHSWPAGAEPTCAQYLALSPCQRASGHHAAARIHALAHHARPAFQPAGAAAHPRPLLRAHTPPLGAARAAYHRHAARVRGSRPGAGPG